MREKKNHHQLCKGWVMTGSVKEFLVHVSWNLNKVKFCIQCIFSVIALDIFFVWMYTVHIIEHLRERERDKAYIVSWRARRALLQFKDSFCWEPEGRYCCTKCMANSALLVLNGTSLICNYSTYVNLDLGRVDMYDGWECIHITYLMRPRKKVNPVNQVKIISVEH